MAPFIERIRAELVAITDRIAAAFNEAADKWTTDKHLTLEEFEQKLSALVGCLGLEGGR